MHHAGNRGLCGSITDHGREQNATQRIAERMSVTAFERFERDNGNIGVLFVDDCFNVRRLQERCISHE